MAKISLRVYNREIEGLIEGGQLDEAIAHCQHILKSFSMHIGTYQLLGKAYLEAHRYSDAVDIFQRVLNAVPDDFISHVGMSIIRDDEGKLDEAIWHMERAFEVQPSNPAIQGELRRLYGQRDGVEPPKIRLSRDALANMYAQGELFNQAIAEIKAVLAEDPERPDLQVMLARAYFKTGQKVEAAEIAAHLLRKYPYCLDALRILAEVLPGTARSENTQVYRTRLRLLDPYSTFVSDSVFNSDQVPDASVSLDRLEYVPGRQVAPSQPAGADSLGIKLDQTRQEAPQPSWLTQAQSEPIPEEPAPRAESEPPGQEEGLPDFLRAAGWSEADGQAPEGVPEAPQAPQEEIAKAEMPDWLKSQLPPELNDVGEVGKAEMDGDLPDWLKNAEIATGAASMPMGESSPEEPLEEIEVAAELPVSETPPESGAGSMLEGDDSVSWLEELAARQDEKTRTEEMMMPDDFNRQGLQAALPPLEQKASISEDVENMPAAVPAPESGEGEVKPLGIEDETMAWLEGLAARQGAKAEELLTRPEDLTEEMPDWLKETASDTPAASLPEEPRAPEIPVQPETFTAPSPAMEQQGIQGVGDEGLAWLEEEGTEPAAASGGETWKTDDEAMPDWLKSVAGETGQEPVGGFEQPQEPELVSPPVELPAKEEKPPEPGAAGTPQDDITITTWLRNLDDPNHPAKDSLLDETRGEFKPAAEEEIPDWLKGLEKPAAHAEPASLAGKPGGADLEVPDWLNQPAEPAEEKPPSIHKGMEEEPPSWIQEEAEPAEQALPTTPAEWMPVLEEKAQEPGSSKIAPPVSEPPLPAAPAGRSLIGKGTGVLSSVPAQDRDASILAGAQQLLDGQKLAEAMKEYGKLIKKGRLLDEVIHDLREALYRHPVDIILWQSLGDAYMRANRLQDALDAYSKAEELLR